MHKDLIAIRFLGGSGGQFLNSFLTAAKFNNKIPLIFGEYGSAHTSYKEIFWHCGPNDPPERQLHMLDEALRYCEGKKTPPPYIMHTHCNNLELLMKYAYKIVNISVTEQDLGRIFYIFVGKFSIESSMDNINIQSWMFEQNPNTFLKRFIPLYSVDNSERVLNIPWKELIHEDTKLLIDKLSNFSSIPKENFLEENLINWRKITIDSISKTMKIFYKYRDEYLRNNQHTN